MKPQRRGVRRRLRSTVRRARVKAGAFVVDNLFRVAAAAGKLHPHANPARHGIEVIRDLPYRDGGAVEHLLDVWRPTHVATPTPIVFYVHGGGFRFLSKDTHWIMALSFARAGYLVFNVSYRLAPRHPFPAAVEDVAEAWQWMLRHAAEYGGDASRIAVAGESAGANLAMGLTLSTCYRRGESHARAVFDAGVVPRACLPMCGMLQVSDAARFARRRKLPRFIADRIDEVAEAYLYGHDGRHARRARARRSAARHRARRPAGSAAAAVLRGGGDGGPGARRHATLAGGARQVRRGQRGALLSARAARLPRARVPQAGARVLALHLRLLEADARDLTRERLQAFAGDATDPPARHHLRAEPAIELLRVDVPIEHGPLEPTAAAPLGLSRQRRA